MSVVCIVNPLVRISKRELKENTVVFFDTSRREIRNLKKRIESGNVPEFVVPNGDNQESQKEN